MLHTLFISSILPLLFLLHTSSNIRAMHDSSALESGKKITNKQFISTRNPLWKIVSILQKSNLYKTFDHESTKKYTVRIHHSISNASNNHTHFTEEIKKINSSLDKDVDSFLDNLNYLIDEEITPLIITCSKDIEHTILYGSMGHIIYDLLGRVVDAFLSLSAISCGAWLSLANHPEQIKKIQETIINTFDLPIKSFIKPKKIIYSFLKRTGNKYIYYIPEQQQKMNIPLLIKEYKVLFQGLCTKFRESNDILYALFLNEGSKLKVLDFVHKKFISHAKANLDILTESAIFSLEHFYNQYHNAQYCSQPFTLLNQPCIHIKGQELSLQKAQLHPQAYKELKEYCLERLKKAQKNNNFKKKDKSIEALSKAFEKECSLH